MSAEENRALWLEVLRWPLASGMRVFVLLFTIFAFLSAELEGGASQSARETRSFGQAAVLFAAVLLLAVASWRAIACTYPAERPVPWLRDETDEAPLSRMIGFFLAVVFISFLPMVLWLSARGPLGAAAWVDWVVIAAASVYAGATLPLGLAAAAVRGTPTAAFPATIIRMRRAEPHAARIAAVTGIAFVGTMVLSFWVATVFVRHPAGADVAFVGEPSRAAVATVGPVAFWSIFLLRAAAFYAAIVSCRVAGLLVREVPEIREVLA